MTAAVLSRRTHSFTRCRLTGVYRLWSSRTEIIYSTFPVPDLATDATPQKRSVRGGLSP